MKLIPIGLASLVLAMSAHAGEVKRYPLPDGNKFPISLAVEVPAGTTLIFESGLTPSPKASSTGGIPGSRP
jgi:hypothetical protein